MTMQAKPAFYALAPGGWRDYVTLLHPPYTAWHLSYVVIGFGLAPELHPWRLVAALAAFFLALGVGAHALDELHGRPLRTRIGDGTLIVLAVASIAGAVAIGIAAAIDFSLPLLAFVAVGAFLVAAYNLELLGGRFHTDLWFGLAWGAFPVLTGYFAAAETLRLEAVAAAVFATLASLAQRVLSTPVRHVRRHVARVTGTLELVDGNREPITEETLLRAPENALRALAAATVALAAALVLVHL
jgi:heme O synthase-like polyprenyltransferase